MVHTVQWEITLSQFMKCAVSQTECNMCTSVHSSVTKQREPGSGQHSLFFQVDYPEIADGLKPRHRFMSAYEQRKEPPDRQWQYLMFAAEPYETIGFKVTQSRCAAFSSL